MGVPGRSDDVDAKARFLDDTGANTFANIIDGDDIWARFGVTEQNTYVYINNDGTWSTARYGSLREDVEALIDQ